MFPGRAAGGGVECSAVVTLTADLLDNKTFRLGR